MASPPLLVVLLPCRLEAFARRDLAESLLSSAHSAAVEPGTLSLSGLSRVSRALTAALAGMQARRMALPGDPRAVVLLDPAQYPLARALLAEHAGAELWYGPEAGAAGEEHELAGARAGLRFDDSPAGRAALAEAIDRTGLAAGGGGVSSRRSAGGD